MDYITNIDCNQLLLSRCKVAYDFIGNNRVVFTSLLCNTAAVIFYFAVPGDSDYINAEPNNKFAKYSVVATIFLGLVAAEVFVLGRKTIFFPFETRQSCLWFCFSAIYIAGTISFAMYVKNSYEKDAKVKWEGFFTSAILCAVPTLLLIGHILADYEKWRSRFTKNFPVITVNPFLDIEEGNRQVLLPPDSVERQLSDRERELNGMILLDILRQSCVDDIHLSRKYTMIIQALSMWGVVIVFCSYFYLWYENQKNYPGATVTDLLLCANLVILALVTPIAKFNSSWLEVHQRHRIDTGLPVKICTIIVHNGMLVAVIANLIYYVFIIVLATAKNYENYSKN
eukprot:gene22317-30561_t